MDAAIEGEDGEYVKIYVTDNSGTEHDITVEMNSGDIAYHNQDSYADDPDKRSPEGKKTCWPNKTVRKIPHLSEPRVRHFRRQ